MRSVLTSEGVCVYNTPFIQLCGDMLYCAMPKVWPNMESVSERAYSLVSPTGLEDCMSPMGLLDCIVQKVFHFAKRDLCDMVVAICNHFGSRPLGEKHHRALVSPQNS